MLSKVLSLVVISAISTSAFALVETRDSREATKSKEERAKIEAAATINKAAKSSTVQSGVDAILKDNANNAAVVALKANPRVLAELSADVVSKLLVATKNSKAMELLLNTDLKADAWTQASMIAHLRLLAHSANVADISASQVAENMKSYKEYDATEGKATRSHTVSTFIQLVNAKAKYLSRGLTERESDILAIAQVKQGGEFGTARDFKMSDLTAEQIAAYEQTARDLKAKGCLFSKLAKN